MLPLQQSQAQQQTQQQQEDLFSSSSQLPNPQAGFRFGNQPAVGQSSQSQANATDEFPPLTRNINGEIGQDRTLGLLQNVGFSAQPGGSAFGSDLGGPQGVRNNGLLNALSGSSRAPSAAARVASPGAFGGKQCLVAVSFCC
jgi:CCR4-NOT transcription complex subunit 2